MNKLAFAVLLFCFSTTTYAQTVDDENTLILAQLGSMNCGFKPFPKLGYRIGRCIDGEWEQVSTEASSGMNCGFKPFPKLGYKIGRCIGGEWEQISTEASSGMNCGFKPFPKLGYKIGRCIGGEWEQVSK
jgi:hypothetical protein